MKVILLQAHGDASQLKEQEMEKPQAKKGEVRIRLKAAGFNPVDFKIRKGVFGGQTPVVLGADCSGVIDAVGEGTKRFAVGDEVYAMAFGQASNGSYAEYLCLPAEFAAKKPKNLSFEQAAAVPLASLTAYRALIAPSAVKKGDEIFIAGAGGGVGSIAVEMARFAGAKTIFTVAGSSFSSEFLQKELKLKKEHILIYKGLSLEQMQQKLVEMHGGHLFDACFDFVGSEMKRLCLNLTGNSGHFSSIVPEDPAFQFPVWARGESLCFNRNLSLHFTYVGAESFSGPRESWSIYSEQLNRITELLESGSIQPPPIHVVGGLKLQTVVEAHKLLEEGKVKGKLVMPMS
jgi:NADPH2:quinone reductase